MRTAILASALLFVACSHTSSVAPAPTPFLVKEADAPTPPAQAAAAREREKMPVSNPHATASAEEMAKNGSACTTDRDCGGRLRCTRYGTSAGRELRVCLLSCDEGCPEGWVCQGNAAYGPRNVC